MDFYRIICYNNYNYEFGGKIMAIEKTSIIGDVLDQYPQTAPVFLSIGMHCLGCPASRGESIADACMVHGVDADELIKKINEVIQ